MRTAFSAPGITLTREGRAQDLWGLAGSASLHEKTLVVTVVNPHALDTRECAIAVRGGGVREARATVLSATDLRAHNSFAQPDALAPRDAPVRVTGGSITMTFPPASVTRLELAL